MEPDLLIIHTGMVNNIDSSGALFSGIIYNNNNSIIEEYGFVWSDSTKPSHNNSRYSNNSLLYGNSIEKNIRSDLSKEITYYVRAYAKGMFGIIYGEEMSFKSMGSSGPMITSFSPESGSAGSTLTISGANFSSNAKHNIVSIGNVSCEVQTAIDTLIEVKIPELITISGKYKIKVNIGDKSTFSSEDFIIAGPIITDFIPESAIEGTLITIDGFGFSSIPSDNLVYFGEINAPVIHCSTTQLIIAVPPTDFAGNVILSVTVDGITGAASRPFMIEGPEIITIEPNTDYTGKTVVVNGKNFSIVPEENILKFGAINAKIQEASTSRLVGVIPYALSMNPGTPVDVSITVTNKTFTLPSSFTSLSPWSYASDFPGQERIGASGFVLGTSAYILGGSYLSGCNCYLKDFWEFNPGNQEWIRKDDFPGMNRAYSLSFAINGKGYMVGGDAWTGNGSGPTNDLWEYDPVLDEWNRKSDTPIHFESEWSMVFIANEKAYFVHGVLLYEFDPSLDIWARKADYPGIIDNTTASSEFCFSLYNKGYVNQGQKQMWEYDPVTNTWSRKSDCPTGEHFFATGFSLNNVGYIGGCLFSNNIKSTEFFSYDPVNDNWDQIPNSLLMLIQTVPLNINDNEYLITGANAWSESVVKTILIFNPNF